MEPGRRRVAAATGLIAFTPGLFVGLFAGGVERGKTAGDVPAALGPLGTGSEAGGPGGARHDRQRLPTPRRAADFPAAPSPRARSHLVPRAGRRGAGAALPGIPQALPVGGRPPSSSGSSAASPPRSQPRGPAARASPGSQALARRKAPGRLQRQRAPRHLHRRHPPRGPGSAGKAAPSGQLLAWEGPGGRCSRSQAGARLRAQGDWRGARSW